MHADPPQARPNRLVQALHGLEGGALVVAFLISMLLPLIDAVGRPFGHFSVPGSEGYRAQLTLWLAFLGGLLAARERRHLTLSTAEAIGKAKVRDTARLFSSSVAAAVCAVLAYSAFGVVAADREQGKLLAIGLPVWVSECIMPLGLALIALRLAWGASDGWRGRAVAFGAVAVAFALGLVPVVAHAVYLPLLAVILLAAVVGAPVFVAMAGVALLLFFKDGVPVSAVTADVYRLMVSPTLPAIPLLTVCGYVLAESKASTRLVRFFRALFGWMPGGVAVLATAVCALFTTFTGGSGVTIMALGPLLYQILRNEGYTERFSLGLVTAAGSLGLLFPPSLPVVLYSIVASVPPDALFIAGLVPGLLLVVIVALYGIQAGWKTQTTRQAFSPREIVLAAWGAKWELSVPTVVVVLFMSGLTTMVEAAGVAFAYAVIIECFITRDIHPVRDLPKVLVDAGVLCGAVLILLSSAMGLTGWLVDAQIPDALLATVKAHISSPHVFLLVLNGVLLVLGSVLEIYSAIIILAPLVAPIGAAFGIDPVHLGVVFLANLELGFLFPPAGLNLFLSSSRFNKPLPLLYRYVVPFLIIIGVGVLLITYAPQMTTGVLKLVGKGNAVQEEPLLDGRFDSQEKPMPNGRFEEMTVGGEPVRLYVSGPGAAPRVVVYHPWWGLNDDVTAYADRLAAAGFSVVAPDLVRGRVASTIEEAERLVNEKDDEHADAVALAAIDRLAEGGTMKVGVVGFSMGAAWSIWCAAKRPAVAASVVYYGTMEGPSLSGSKAPVLGHFAESDPYEKEESAQAFERALRDAGRSVVIHRYPGTGHWFAEPSQDAWRPEAADLAFERTVTFLREHLR